MAKGKKYTEAKNKVDAMKVYPVADAVSLLKEVSYTKFTASVEIAIKTNANPKYNDQMIRSTIVLPHGTGKKVVIAAFVDDDKRDDAKKAGADIVGNEELIKDIKDGNIKFDVLITEPTMMRNLAPIAKILGPKGLMPSPKAGTVSPNIKSTIEQIKKGRVAFKLDKTGNIHALIGKMTFDNDKIAENVEAIIKAVIDNKPTGVKGKLIKKAVISSTMSPGIQVEVQQ